MKKKIFTINEAIYINQFVQGIHQMDELTEWFCTYNDDDQKKLLMPILHIVMQSHPTIDEIRSGLKSLDAESSRMASVMLNTRIPFYENEEAIIEYEEDLVLNFRILIVILRIADTRRKNTETYCNHWWHKDLSDEAYLQELRNDYL